MSPLSMMGLMFSIGMSAAEFAQDAAMDASGNSMDEGQESGSSSSSLVEGASAFMAGTAVKIGTAAAGGSPFGPAVAATVETIEKVYEDPVSAIVAAEVGCHSNADCPQGFACVFSPGAEEGTCILLGEIGVRIVGVIDGVTCDFCLSQIGRTGALDSIPIPPFHKHCRCSLVYLE